MHNQDSSVGAVFKYKWVPNGEAILQIDWGEDGGVTWGQPDFYHMNAITDGNYIYVTSNTYKESDVMNDFRVVDYDGFLDSVIDYSYFWGDLDDLEADGQANGGPDLMRMRDNIIYLGCHCSSLQQAVNSMAARENEDDFEVVFFSIHCK